MGVVTRFTLALILFCPLAPLAHSQERPDWISKLPKSSTDQFYIGRSSNAPTETEGIKQATHDAYFQAIRENFGILTKVSKETYSGLDSESSLKRFQEVSRNVEVRGFEQTDFFVESTKGSRFNVWVLYRYPKSEIQKEKKRLSRATETKSKLEFSVQGNLSDHKNGTLEIVTEPPGAKVYIDGEVYGRTPLRLIGQLSIGPHELRLDKESYGPIHEKVILIPNKTASIQRTLLRSPAKLKITSSPENANVIINGKPVGLTPTEFVTVEAGRSIEIQLSHSEAERVSQGITLGRDEEKNLHIEMQLKPAYLTVFTVPSNAGIELNGVVLKSPVIRHHVDAKTEVNLRATKDGYRDELVKLNLRGGEKKTLRLKLLSLTEVEKRRMAKEVRERERLRISPWISGFRLGYGTGPIRDVHLNTVFFEGSVEKRFLGLFGVKGIAGLMYGFGGDKVGSSANNDYTHQLRAIDLRLGTPFYPYKGVFLEPAVGFLKGSYTRTAVGSDFNVGLNLPYYSLGIGYEWENVNLSTEVRNYQGDTQGISGGAEFRLGIGLQWKW